MNNAVVDPSHNDVVQSVIKTNFHEHSLMNKLGVILTIFSVFPGVIFQALTHKLGLRKNTKENFKLKQVTPFVYIGVYKTPGFSSNCVIIKGKDGKLFIRSPPAFSPSIVDLILEIGEPSIFFASITHDTYVDQWKARFPNSKVIAEKQDISIVNHRCKVDVAIEDYLQELKDNFYVTQLISRDFSNFKEGNLLIDLGEGKVGVSMCCGFGNNKFSFSMEGFTMLVGGALGLRLTRPFSFLFTKNLNQAEGVWKEIYSIPGLYAVFFLHGEPLIGENVKQEMKKVNILNSRRFF